MKTWNCQVKSKEDLTTDLMFKEIMELREEAVQLSTYLWELCDVVNNSKEITPYLRAKVKKTEEFRNAPRK
jgi:hypothetical protein